MKSKFQAAAVQIAWRGTRAARRYQLPDRLAGVAYHQAPSASKHVTTIATAWRFSHHRPMPTFQNPTVPAPFTWRDLPLRQAPLAPEALYILVIA